MVKQAMGYYSDEKLLADASKIYAENSFYKIVKRTRYGIDALAYSPNGKYIAVSSNKLAFLLNADGGVVDSFFAHTKPITSITFSPDSKFILTGSSDSSVKLWTLSGKMLHQFIGHTAAVNCVAFSPDGKSIATGSADSTALLWDLQGNILKKFFSGRKYNN